MIIKTLELELYIAHSNSLKDKRRVIKSMTQRLRQKFNVSVSEIGNLDGFRDASIGIAVLTNSQRYADTVLDQCLNLIETEYDVELIDVIKESR